MVFGFLLPIINEVSMFNSALSFEVFVRMVVAGTFFGLWPILKEYSGADGLSPVIPIGLVHLFLLGIFIIIQFENSGTLRLLLGLSAIVFCALFFQTMQEHVVPTLSQGVSVGGAYVYIVGAGLCIGFGTVAFLTGLQLAHTAGGVHAIYVPFVVMILVQTAIPLAFHATHNGTQLNWVNIIGVPGALLVIFALSYKTSGSV